jgi:hypothetical protein
MKITVLTYLESEGEKKRDVVVDQVVKALKEDKHKVSGSSRIPVGKFYSFGSMQVRILRQR